MKTRVFHQENDGGYIRLASDSIVVSHDTHNHAIATLHVNDTALTIDVVYTDGKYNGEYVSSVQIPFARIVDALQVYQPLAPNASLVHVETVVSLLGLPVTAKTLKKEDAA